MIEELLVKNAQLADENVAAQQMRGPFGVLIKTSASKQGSHTYQESGKTGNYVIKLSQMGKALKLQDV